MRKTLTWACIGALAAVLTACGGGSDSDDTGNTTPGAEAWVAGQYKTCFPSQVSGVISSTGSELLVDDDGVYFTRLKVYANSTACAGTPFVTVRYPTGQFTTVGTATVAVPGGTAVARKVSVTTPAGVAVASGDANYYVVTTNLITVYDPNSSNMLMQLDRNVAVDNWKDLLWLQGSVLRFGDDSVVDADGFPTTLDFTSGLTAF